MSELNIANSAKQLVDYLNDSRLESNFKLIETTISNQSSWKFRDGGLSHQTNGFFHVVGVEAKLETSQQHLMLYQPQSALTGLIFCKTGNDIYVLLQRRVEPGNTDIVQYGPTIQSTPANYLKLHGGKSTPLVDEFTSFRPGVNLITHSIQHDLGKRYYQKSKTHHYLEVNEMLNTDKNMIWASLNSISELLKMDNFFNADLRSLLSVFNWDAYFNQLSNKTNLETNELNIQNNLNSITDFSRASSRLIPLDRLKNWKIEDSGIVDSNNTGCSVSMFYFENESREVAKWTQPLFCVKGTGLIQLATRTRNDKKEFLITVAHEVGISSRYALYPSHVRYPEEKSTNSQLIEGKILVEFTQCDEGGRFYQNDSLYQIIEVSAAFKEQQNQLWMNQQTLINHLEASNIASFQLRCICSGILKQLHPGTFKNTENPS